MPRRVSRTKLFNNDGHLLAVRRITDCSEDSFVWGLLDRKPTFREVWISETWLQRRAIRDVMLRPASGYRSACRTCKFYEHYKNLFDPLRRIKKRLWGIRMKSIDSQRERKAS